MSSPAATRAIHQATDLLNASQYARAVEFLTAALRRDPRDPHLHHLLGAALIQTGDGQRALFHLQSAHAALGDDPRTLMQLGMAHQLLRKFDLAGQFFQRAHRADPSNFASALNYAIFLYREGDLVAADSIARHAQSLQPDRAEGPLLLGSITMDAGDADTALTILRAALARHPHREDLAATLITAGNYASNTTGQELCADHRNYVSLIPHGPVRSASSLLRTPDPHRPLTIAYISQDLRNRSVGHFAEPLFTHHDRNHFRIHALNLCDAPDEHSALLRSHCVGWHDVHNLSHDRIVSLADPLHLDILIDLAGHTGGSCIPPLLRRLAPIQITYCGYPNTTGLPSMDYRIVDPLTDPPGSESHATETLLRLNRFFLCYSPPSHAAPVPRAPKLPDSPIVFGSFNTNSKIGDHVLRSWATLLQRVPNSRLVIKNKALGNPDTITHVRSRAARAGMPIDLLELRGETASPRDHLLSYADIDIALDPFPYSGTTTTAEALVSGVPVVTFIGDRHVSRVGHSMLTYAGFPELVAPNHDRYLDLAASLAHDRAALANYHTTTRDRFLASPVCDQQGFVREFESALRHAWVTICGKSI